MKLQRVAATVFLAVGLAGCAYSAGHDVEQRAPACDEGIGASTREQAVRTLLRAAEQSDSDLACTVIIGFPPGMDLGDELDRLRQDAQRRGITAENARLTESGSASKMPIHQVTGPVTSGLEPLEFQFDQPADRGLRVVFPPIEERSA